MSVPRCATAVGTLLAILIVVAGGCGSRQGPPAIPIGAECRACGMTIEDPRFACERRAGDRWRVYDSIECLLRDGGVATEPVARGAGRARADRGPAAFLADYDRRELHAAESLWVVKGSFPSPMGGGLAAFLDRAAADTIAARTRGRVTRLAALAEQDAR